MYVCVHAGMQVKIPLVYLGDAAEDIRTYIRKCIQISKHTKTHNHIHTAAQTQTTHIQKYTHTHILRWRYQWAVSGTQKKKCILTYIHTNIRKHIYTYTHAQTK